MVSSADKGPKLRLGLSRRDSFFVIVNESSLVSQRPCKLISFGVGFRWFKVGRNHPGGNGKSYTNRKHTDAMPISCIINTTY